MKQDVYFWWLPLIILFSGFFFLQANIFLNADVIYLMNAAKLMLEGGTYSQDFFETNPPLIFYLYFVPVLLSKYLHLPLASVLHAYIALLILLSLSLSYVSLQKLNPDRVVKFSLLYSSALTLLFLAPYDTGQREHFTQILVLPYLLLSMLRLEVKDKDLSPILIVTIALLAAIGFSIKPFFLTTLILIELYLIWIKKNIYFIFRLETMVIASFMLCYLVSIYFLQADYYDTILPIVMRVYFIGNKQNLTVMFAEYSALFCFAIILFYLFTHNILSKNSNHILFLATLGFTLSFLIPQNVWFYHVLPAFGCAIILFTVTIFSQIKIKWQHEIKNKSARLDKWFLPIVGLIILALPTTFTAFKFKNAYAKKHSAISQSYLAFFSKQSRITYQGLGTYASYLIASVYANGVYVGRYSSLWWILGIDELKQRNDLKKNHQLAKDEEKLINILAEDITLKKPQYILVDTMMIHPRTNQLVHLHYVEDFSKFSSFKQAWRDYRLLTHFGRFNVYERKGCL